MDAPNPVPSTSPNPTMMPSTVPNPTVLPSTIPNPTIVQSLFGQTGVDASALLQLSQTMQVPVAQQYHHALLMQQVQAKAMSAAEIALKRAAEINKNILSSNTPDKKSPQESKSRSVSKSKSRSPSQSKSKSRSRSPSRSKSKSKSRSRSRTPIRYRHRRSVSPIRYRRDYYRPRNQYYGYRGNNYNRYYRGSYNDYSRYSYGRDRYRERGDYSYHRRSRSRERRRSRTKSTSPRKDRSRGRKRSNSISISPMKRSPTPTLGRSHKKSLSPDAKRVISRSRDTSQESISGEEAKSSSPSPSPKARSRSQSQEKGRRDHRSLQSEDLDEDGMAVHEVSKSKGRGRIQGSESPNRSRFVSHNYERQKNASEEEPNWSPAPEKTQQHSSPAGSLSGSLESKYSSRSPRKIFARKRSSSMYSLPEEMCAEELGQEGKGSRTERHSVGRSRVRKHKLGSSAIGDDESESDEVMEDWRDDLKIVARRKEAFAQKEVKSDNSDERIKLVGNLSSPVDLLISNNEQKHESVSHSASSEGKNGSTLAMAEKDSFLYKGCKVVVECKKEEIEKGHALEVEVGGECNEFERDAEENVIYEGPIPASLACEEGTPRIEGGTHTHAPVLGSHSPEPPNAPKLSRSALGKKSSSDAADDTPAFSKCQHNLEQAMDKPRSRNHEVESLKHEKHRDRHKKHRRKRRHETVDEDYSNSDGADLLKHEKPKDRGNKKHRKKHRHENVDEDDTDSDGARKRYKRKHKRDVEHRHGDRKRKKHKHRIRSSSESTEDISSTGEDEVPSSRKRKKGSRKHKSSKRDVESPSSSIPVG